MTETAQRSVTHAAFTLERTYPAPAQRVWDAFATEEGKRAWFFAEGEEATTKFSEDFRVGGHGVNEGRWGDGPSHRFRSTYTDIVDRERIVYTYDMWIDDKHISTSLATIELETVDGGTRLVLTEQGVHLDGTDNGEMREQGTNDLLDALGRSLER